MKTNSIPMILSFLFMLFISCEKETENLSDEIIDLCFPNGYGGENILINSDTSFTIPSGKSLYFTAGSTGVNDCSITTEGKKYYIDGTGVISENTEIIFIEVYK